VTAFLRFAGDRAPRKLDDDSRGLVGQDGAERRHRQHVGQNRVLAHRALA